MERSVTRDEPAVKGQTLNSFLKFVATKLTPEQRSELIAVVPAELRPYVERGGVLPTQVIPMSVLNRLTEQAARLAGEPLPQFARQAGRFSAGEAVRGVYRFFARVLTPDALLGRAASMWTAMNTVGRMEIERQAERAAVIRLLNFPSEAVMCARIGGWIDQMIELTGTTKYIVVQTQCVANGDPCCEWKLTW